MVAKKKDVTASESARVRERETEKALPNVYADEVIEHVVYSHPCKHPFSSVR